MTFVISTWGLLPIHPPHLPACTPPLQVSEMHPADQKLLAPVMQSPVLRQLLIAMFGPASHEAPATPASGSASSMGWLANPRVLQLLREAARALKKGLLTEGQLVKLLQQEVKVGAVCH